MNGFETILPFLKPIEHLILDDAISEVMVNGPDHIFIEKAGFIEPVQGIHLGEKSLMVAVKNIARRLGDDISEAKPILDSRLPDGSRVAAVIPPCSLGRSALAMSHEMAEMATDPIPGGGWYSDKDNANAGDTPTSGYRVLNMGFGVRIPDHGMVHNISIHCDNVFNTTYRDNLSVVKSFLPQPGRGFRLNYELIY